ncbi:MAG: hypothetical protein Q4A56_05855 [Porphyromonadaceae bacterium]|nr:hypothetical protein [Porphyromonadaceae bacterium]
MWCMVGGNIYCAIRHRRCNQIFYQYSNKGLTYRFALNYTDRNGVELKQYKTFNELQSYLEQQNLYPQIVKFAEQNGVVGKET